MFDQFTAIIYAFTGKLKSASTLRKYFWVFLAGSSMALIILSYNAFMSLNFYRQLLERFTPWESLLLPVLTTSTIALTVFMLMSAITGTILDYNAGRDGKIKGHEPMFIATISVLIGFLCLNIYANLKGVEYVSELTTEEVVENNSANVFESVNTQIAKQEQLLTNLLAGEFGGYGWWQDKSYHLNNSGKQFQRSLVADIKQLRDQQKLMVSTAVITHEDDKERFESEITVKRKSHVKLVWFAYPLALLICFIVQHYAQRTLAFVEGEPDPNAQGSATPDATPTASGIKDLNGFCRTDNEGGTTLHVEGSATPVVAIPNLTEFEAAFLQKWKEAVGLIVNGYSNKEVIDLYDGPQGQIRRTTIGKPKTVLRAKGIMPEYQSV